MFSTNQINATCRPSISGRGYCCPTDAQYVVQQLKDWRQRFQAEPLVLAALQQKITELETVMATDMASAGLAEQLGSRIVAELAVDTLERMQILITETEAQAVLNVPWRAARLQAMERAAPYRVVATTNLLDTSNTSGVQAGAAARARPEGARPENARPEVNRAKPKGPYITAAEAVLALTRLPQQTFTVPDRPLDDATVLQVSRKPPQAHQVAASRHILNHRGVIVAHDVGLGKTLTAILGAELLLRNGLVDRVIIVTPSFVVSTFAEALHRDYGATAGATAADTAQQYTILSHKQFYSQYSHYIEASAGAATVAGAAAIAAVPDNMDEDADMAENTSGYRVYFADLQAKLQTDMNRTCLIIDEAHTYRTEIDIHGSGSGRMTFVMAQAAYHATRVMALTATPMVNGPLDICNLVAMIKGDAWPNVVAFQNALALYANKKAINAEQAQRFMFDFIAQYCPNMFSFARIMRETIADTRLYPTVEYVQHRIVMNNDDIQLFRGICAKQQQPLECYRLPQNPLPFNVGLRQAMNIISQNPETGVYYSRKAIELAEILNPIKNTPAGRSIIFTHWLHNGATRIAEVLQSYGINSVIITGQTRVGQRLVNKKLFDDGIAQVIILSSAASEGLNFTDVRHVFIFDPAWNSAREQQAIGRATRLRSHANLDRPEDRHVVVHRMLMVASNFETTDARMYTMARNKDEIINLVQRALEAVAIATPLQPVPELLNREQAGLPAPPAQVLQSAQVLQRVPPAQGVLLLPPPVQRAPQPQQAPPQPPQPVVAATAAAARGNRMSPRPTFARRDFSGGLARLLNAPPTQVAQQNQRDRVGNNVIINPQEQRLQMREGLLQQAANPPTLTPREAAREAALRRFGQQ